MYSIGYNDNDVELHINSSSSSLYTNSKSYATDKTKGYPKRKGIK